MRTGKESDLTKETGSQNKGKETIKSISDLLALT